MLKPFLVSVLTLFIIAFFLPNVGYTDIPTLILAGVVLTVLNKVVKPVLKLLTLPINVVTIGLFGTVINALLLWLLTYLVPGFSILPMTVLGVGLNQFFTLVLMSVLIGLTQGLVAALL